jgi:arginase family enzyme
MTEPERSPQDVPRSDGVTLRLLWPQWQGAGSVSVRELASEFPFDVARRGYAVGSAVLGAVLPAHNGPTATVPVGLGDNGVEERDGVEAKAAVVEQLARALEVIGRHAPARIATLGGDCGLHAWTEDDFQRVAEWGIQSFGPDDLRDTARPLLDCSPPPGCSRVASHFDVDTIDSGELGAEPGGLTTAQARRIVAGVDAATDVVGFTIAEFFPRQVMHLQQLVTGFPLLSGPVGDAADTDVPPSGA